MISPDTHTSVSSGAGPVVHMHRNGTYKAVVCNVKREGYGTFYMSGSNMVKEARVRYGGVYCSKKV